jgi:hypothetical protein
LPRVPLADALVVAETALIASPGDAGKLLLIGGNSAAHSVACEGEEYACNFLREAPNAENRIAQLDLPARPPFTDEQRLYGILIGLAHAESDLRLPIVEEGLPFRERAERILKHASGSRRIEPHLFQLAWLITRTPAFAPNEDQKIE